MAALAALALGGVAVGLTEFVAMGLLPDIARGLLPHEYARSSSDAVARAGWMITAYALGVVVGAPLIAALSARLPRKKLVLGLLVLFAVGTVASALAPTFDLVLVARFAAALPHGAYFGAAGLLAATLMGPGNEARGFATVLGGLTVSNAGRRTPHHAARAGGRLACRVPGHRRLSSCSPCWRCWRSCRRSPRRSTARRPPSCGRCGPRRSGWSPRPARSVSPGSSR